MRFVSGALRRFWWLLPVCLAAGALGALVYEGRKSAVRYTASAAVALGGEIGIQ